MKVFIKRCCVCLPLFLGTTVLGTTAVYSMNGEFSTLAYNVAGLPEIVSSAESHRQQATEQISCYVNAFDIVNVQEDFNYHAALYDTCDNHTYRSPTSGGAGVGSGLNTLSRFPYEDWERVRWTHCSGVDCLTPKGFTLARVQLQDGVFVDIYNLHTQAQTETADLVARRANLLQLADYVELHSVGNAVIIMGDTNTRYTRSGDNIREFLNRGFTDAWLKLVRKNDIPGSGDEAMVCHPPVTAANCEIVDKILYRDNGYLQLQAYRYDVREDAKTSAGLDLSDHPPVETRWTYNTRNDWKFSTRVGGPHGTEFNDYALLPEHPAVRTLSISAGTRIDQIQTTLDNGYTMTHGGHGGTARSLTLNSGEYLQSATICTGLYNGHSRIFYTRFTTNQNRSLASGSQTDTCTIFTAENQWSIVGFHGRSGEEIDKLGVIYAPVRSSMAPALFKPWENLASGQCLEMMQTNPSDKASVGLETCSGEVSQQWNYDKRTGLMRSRHDSEYCLGNTGTFSTGTPLMASTCTGKSSQRFTLNEDGTIALRTMPTQGLEADGKQLNTGKLQRHSAQYWQ